MHTRKSLLATAIAAAMACVALPASAQTSAAMKVTATITPAACRIMLDQTEIDKGTFSAKDLHPTNSTNHGEEHTFTVTTACDSAAATYLKFADNQAESAIPVVGNPVTPDSFGLGYMDGNKKIGGYQIKSADPVTYDGVDGIVTWSDDAIDGHWRPYRVGMVVRSTHRWGVTNSTNANDAPPVAAKDISQPFKLSVLTLNNTTEMPVTSEVRADGQFTVELHTL